MSGVAKGVIVDRGLLSNTKKTHGINPILLVEKIIRELIFDSIYWQETCIPLNLLTLLDEVVLRVKLIGTYSNGGRTRPTKFVCIVLRLLQIQPAFEITQYLLQQTDFKYLRAIAALYIRLTRSSVEVYTLLEQCLTDYRHIRIYNDGHCSLIHMDEYIDQLLNEDKFCDLILPRMISRYQLEQQELIEPRISILQEEFDEMVDNEEH